MTMSSQPSLFPVREDVEREVSARDVSLSDAGDVVEALNSETAREIVAAVSETPATTSDVAATVDTSLQNARYHLNRLDAVGVLEVVDTWYSDRGRAMDVYGPASEPLRIVVGGTEEPSDEDTAVGDAQQLDADASGVALCPDGGVNAGPEEPK